MMLIPPTWIADTYLGRAPAGRSRVLRLSCYRDAEDGDRRGEFFVKAVGLPEITEQHLFSEVIGNILARELGILVPNVALIEITSDFAALLRAQARADVVPGIAVGSRSLGSSLSPPVFGRMSEAQAVQAARIYVFDMLVQNPDRRVVNGNCFVVHDSLAAIDFADCFSFLYPLFGQEVASWHIPERISTAHLFRGTLDRASVKWEVLFADLREALDRLLTGSVSWVPPRWERWMKLVRNHLAEVRAHFDDFRWEILRSIP